jgi:hypothetical protein
MLKKFYTNYVVLEAHGVIALLVNASISLIPNGLLILNQIGYYKAIQAKVANYEIETSHIRNSKGKSISCSKGFISHLERR